VNQYAEEDRGEQQQQEIKGQPGDDAQQHHRGQHCGLRHGTIGNLLRVVLRRWRGHGSPPDEYKGTTGHAAL